MRLRGSRHLASFLMIATLPSDTAHKPWEPADRDSNVASIQMIELTRQRLADRPDGGGGDATLAGARIDPVPNFGRARLSQAQADPAHWSGSGSILSYELSPATAIPASDIHLLVEGRRIFEPVGRGNLHEAL
jgi:hypothetical protein